ncbi:hypothetical protein A2331_01170 [Candidatus Falkowbacteria bacterium RIFOXYB2_FULL_34_18]|uniref:ADP-ribosylglycohydrolase n=1 Tax=Candidatus Falkowbacteria bacterium RIFOXYD2_FULL_34_120 TaxID=1798007 RepID=A0A1F5TPU5_9BACT|nr:MAG: hypothetical protein A2331_01170 [Candidatus Falkowbacteria bacterium RIFOXYB2_FULL_34_18]OGF29125.1 MAG: hypothetical protein A2500_02780 [Candidatus Falkowbacteria bacterium RIFOXYC12_FULL_34_55]OGF36221.1 MAG: hypothetical protein A2466_04950 [Candidatus Falkowbacteria bacterium RIFOXYC2_FULL_34_220]OGF38635.1 MAG: hypothetical protein A2515_06910 [Candidatus Falkowbacteria bacterium RIFOXYD12_FULL_34_57]OGF40824.1 MAG: hypothetical protein A2531_06615 [Candidatus Falkowbacteria bact
MLNPNPNFLAFTGIGDAYLLPLEFLNKQKMDFFLLKENLLNFKGYQEHPVFHIGNGCYTDDTERCLANSHVLINNQKPFTKLMFADAYINEFIRGGQRKGYANGFYNFLRGIKTGKEFLEKIKNDSVKNGACMGVVPIGVLPNIHDVVEVAQIQASVTHNTPEGLFSAKVVALMSHFAFYTSEPLKNLKEYCLHLLPPKDVKNFGHIFINIYDGKPISGKAIPTVHAALDILGTQKSLKDILIKIIHLGGDTDSAAAICMGIASNRYKNEILPPFMFRDLERKNYLLDIGKQLINKFSNSK